MVTNELTFCHFISLPCMRITSASLGAYDDPNGSHISIEVVSEKFEGKRAVQRQQMVYKAIWEELAGPVHAVDSMICKTPTE
jgi:stress-induced morphogen